MRALSTQLADGQKQLETHRAEIARLEGELGRMQQRSSSAGSAEVEALRRDLDKQREANKQLVKELEKPVKSSACALL